jgi:hypothetical protein
MNWNLLVGPYAALIAGVMEGQSSLIGSRPAMVLTRGRTAVDKVLPAAFG